MTDVLGMKVPRKATTWRPIDTAPTSTPVLLWARLSSAPPEPSDHFPIVGVWHRALMRWKVSPELLNAREELIATHWAPIPNPPEGQP